MMQTQTRKPSKAANKQVKRKSDQLQSYWSDIHQYPLLSREEEKNLIRQWRETGDETLRQRLIEGNLRFVLKLAYEYRHYGTHLQDLVQEGNMGLIKALERFDPDRGVRLTSYAVWWIRAYIQSYILNNWRLIRLGKTNDERKLFFSLNKAKRAISRLNGKENVERSEIAHYLGVKEETVEQMELRMQNSELSLDTPLKYAMNESVTVADTLSLDEPCPEEQLVVMDNEGFRKQKLHDAVSRLSEREQFVLQRRRLSDSPETLRAIGEEMGVSRERVRQIEARAMRKLHDALAPVLGSDITPPAYAA
ncbi:MAG: sigma-70 family RNA polymerase sigma factor [Deltaproteobacteria bacterium]|nr:MAG: sigma-70 family RNA polymerase sigma factor [Deltaproteobacteria bacterium]